MQANVGRETGVERTVRHAVHAAGLRYRKDARPEKDLRCNADLVFASEKVCVFVDGCFWHGCPKHFVTPKANPEWWKEKIEANVKRDRRQTATLRARGWVVLRFWEHEACDLSWVVRRIVTSVARKRARA